METLTYGSGRASGCDSPGPLNVERVRVQDPHQIVETLPGSGIPVVAGCHFVASAGSTQAATNRSENARKLPLLDQLRDKALDYLSRSPKLAVG